MKLLKVSNPERTPESYRESILAFEGLIEEWQRSIVVAIEEIQRLEDEWLDMEEAS